MDRTTLLGLVLAIGAVLGGALLDGIGIMSLLSLPAFLIVLGGTVGATVISNPFENVIRLPSLLRRALFFQGLKGEELVDLFVSLATKARKEGVLSLEAQVSQLDDPFLRKGIQLVIDGTDEEVIAGILNADIAAMTERHRSGYTMFEMMGGFAPTLGILGAVLGLIHVLSKVDDPTKLAGGIAVAFVATLYGVGSANLIFFPIGNKLRARSEEEAHLRRLILQGVLAIQAGDNPRIVRDKLDVFVAPRYREGAPAVGQSRQPSAPGSRAAEAV